MTRCAFCHTLRAVLGDYCSDGCRERAMREGRFGASLPANEHSLRLLGSRLTDPDYYAGVRHFGGHSTLEALGTIGGGRRGRDSKGKS